MSVNNKQVQPVKVIPVTQFLFRAGKDPEHRNAKLRVQLSASCLRQALRGDKNIRNTNLQITQLKIQLQVITIIT